jgi:hypothetical protein
MYKSLAEPGNVKVDDKVWSSAINGGAITVGYVATVGKCQSCDKEVITLIEDYNVSDMFVPQYHSELFVVLEGEQ